MNLHEGTLFWPTTFTKQPHKNPPVRPHYDAIIVGGGMSGLLTAHALLQEGLTVALLEKNEIGAGSTAANTGLLQYSNDIMLHELAQLIGEQNAVRFYKLCYEALDGIEAIANTLPDNADFIRRPSICFASKKGDAKKLQKEYAMLEQHGFPASYWDEQQVTAKLPFSAPAALYTENDAEINPYKFVVALAQKLQIAGLDIFEKTMVNVIEDEGNRVILHTIEGVFETSNIVYTTGYGKLPYGKVKGANINRSYAIVTEQKSNFTGWYENALIWETARPYIYMRMTTDNRVVFGGLDEGKAKPVKKEQKREKMADKLLEKLHELIPNKTFTAPYQYCATFGESDDHLPFIGQHPQQPNHFYLLGYGGNGTVYSMLGSNILADLIQRRPNNDAQLVTMDRLKGIRV